MATKRVKQNNGTEEDLEPESISADRLSELPEAIILHILSFLPTIFVVRTSLLSKRWRHMWTLISVLDFYDQRDLDYLRRPNKTRDRRKFFKFVEKCLKHPYADTTITKFKLDMELYGGTRRVDGWLRFPVSKNVKELDLQVRPTKARYCLPNAILCSRTLTSLKLTGLELMINSPIVCLPSLKVLFLMGIKTENQALVNLLLGCPSLEKLYLLHCYGLVNPLVLSLSLKSMEYVGSASIKVEARNLHSFEFNGGHNINLFSCVAIRNLMISNVSLTGQWLEDLIPQLLLLESLNLKSCYGVEHIKIRNPQLKNLHFDCCVCKRDLREVTIDTPSLVSFSYSGYLMLKISMNAPKLLNANISIRGQLENKGYDMEWYTSLVNFLSEIGGIKSARMFCGHEKVYLHMQIYFIVSMHCPLVFNQ